MLSTPVDTKTLYYVDTHCNVPNILQALKVDYNDPAPTWDSLVSWFPTATPKPKAPPKNVKTSLPATTAVVTALGACISVASDMASHQDTLDLLKCDNVYGAFGIHPLYAYEYEEGEKHKVAAMSHEKTVAYGLDYHVWPESYNYAKPELQKKIFISQIKHALEWKKPIIIHTREAEEDTLQIMREYIPNDWKLHVHCFTDSLEFCQQLIKEWPNLWIGFTGVITFKNSKMLQQVAAELPLDRLLLETDGPFMTPEPYRGKVCHPGHVPLIAAKIAELKNIAVEEVYAACRENTQKMYGVTI